MSFGTPRMVGGYCQPEVVPLVYGAPPLRLTPLTYNQIVLADLPVGFWPLNESSGTTANDATGNGYNGNYSGGYTLNGATSPMGDAAAYFNGSLSHVDIPTASGLNLTGSLSLEGWCKWTSGSAPNTWIAIIAKGDSAYRMGQNGVSATQAYFDSDPNGSISSTGTPSIFDGAWHYVAATYSSSGSFAIYIDGVLSNSGSGGTSPGATNSYDLWIGDNSQNSGRNWIGDLSRIAVYNYALTSTQISTHYAAA